MTCLSITSGSSRRRRWSFASKSASLQLLPANIVLANAEKQLVTQLNRERRLIGILKQLGEYDRVIIDCPPSLSILTTNALAAADEVLIPIETDYLALLALQPLVTTHGFLACNIT